MKRIDKIMITILVITVLIGLAAAIALAWLLLTAS